MNVMLADIEAEALNAAVKNLRAKQINAEGIVTDVSRRNSVKDAAAETVRIFNKVHLVCNNAGVAPTGPLGSMKALDWDWAIGKRAHVSAEITASTSTTRSTVSGGPETPDSR
jgi:NADP-dependent 3-hydroxy acid dehydrogenase YdfG